MSKVSQDLANVNTAIKALQSAGEELYKDAIASLQQKAAELEAEEKAEFEAKIDTAINKIKTWWSRLDPVLQVINTIILVWAAMKLAGVL